MGIATTALRFDLIEMPWRIPGQWRIEVTNRSSFAATFTPLSVLVESEHMELETIRLLTEGNSYLQPGASIEYILYLKREGFHRLDGWMPKEIDPGERLTLILNHLGAGGGPTPAILRLTL